MAVANIEFQIHDVTVPLKVSSDSLCVSCTYKGKSFVCLIPTKSKDGDYPNVMRCEDYREKII